MNRGFVSNVLSLNVDYFLTLSLVLAHVQSVPHTAKSPSPLEYHRHHLRALYCLFGATIYCKTAIFQSISRRGNVSRSGEQDCWEEGKSIDVDARIEVR